MLLSSGFWRPLQASPLVRFRFGSSPPQGHRGIWFQHFKICRGGIIWTLSGIPAGLRFSSVNPTSKLLNIEVSGITTMSFCSPHPRGGSCSLHYFYTAPESSCLLGSIYSC